MHSAGILRRSITFSQRYYLQYITLGLCSLKILITREFLMQVIDSEETTMFFEVLMPKIVQLALQLPVLLTGAVPLLKRHSNDSISLSQLQVASLLANAFFCTFPRRNSNNPQSEYATYPYINFNR